jgi:DNA repair photolyase
MFVGIARLARQGETLEHKTATIYQSLPTRRLLNRCSSQRMPFPWTINPYRGCEIGCQYCYARYTHEFMEYRDPLEFETRIFAKDFTVGDVRAELRRVPLCESIAIGTATDPYQPAERRFHRTRRILEALALERGRTLVLTTKSDLVTRDLDLLMPISQANQLGVHMTVTTADDRLARLLEPKAPRPGLRFDALARLSRAGIHTGVFTSPVLPGLNDSLSGLEAVARATAACGAKMWGARAVFLRSPAREHFFTFLECHAPRLLPAYRAQFQRSAFLRGAYPGRLRRMVHELRERYGLNAPMLAATAPWQMPFDFGAAVTK